MVASSTSLNPSQPTGDSNADHPHPSRGHDLCHAGRGPCRRRHEALRQRRHRRHGARQRDRRLQRPGVHRHHGAVRLRQEHPDAQRRRPRHAHLGQRLHRRHRPVEARRPAAHAAAPGQDRLHLPGVQPHPDVDRPREHHPPDGPRRPQARPGLARPRRRHRRPLAAPRAPPERALGRPAAARRRGPGPGRPSRDHLRGRAHRQPRLPHGRRDPVVHAHARCTSSVRPSSWSPTTPSPPPTPSASCSSPTARSSTRCPLRRPSACSTASRSSGTDHHVQDHPQEPRPPASCGS